MLKLKALDTLFFRDGKPFNKDGDNWVSCFFPPASSVFYGAIRSAFFADNISQLRLANTSGDPTSTLRIKGVFLLINNNLYFPLPLDMVKNKGKKEIVRLLNLKECNFVSNCPTEMVLLADEGSEVESIKDGLLDDISLKDYLSGTVQQLPFRQMSEFVTQEPKIGVGLNPVTGQVRDGHLYRVGMVRPSTISKKSQGNYNTRNVSILIDFEGLTLPPEGFMKVGGEGKAAYYEHYEGGSIATSTSDWVNFDTNRFKVYLATPAKFSNGWLPNWIDETTLTGTYKGHSLRLLTAAIGRYVSIGGFDIKENRPKTMVRTVPAGSVYYFEILDNSKIQEVVKKFHYSNISDFDSDQGFGLSFVGVVQ